MEKTQEEILYHIFQGEEEKALQKKGRQVYARAGFEEEMKARYQSRMVQYIVRSGGVFLGAYLLITAAAYIRMREAVRRKEQEFEQFGSVIEQFYTGHYQVAYREEEGMKQTVQQAQLPWKTFGSAGEENPGRKGNHKVPGN